MPAEGEPSLAFLMFVAGLLSGKRILITGGGTGLGRSIGRRYLDLGADLLICGRRAAVLETTALELRAETGGRVKTHVCDIRDPAAVDQMMTAIWAEAPLDGLLNNAAGNFISRTERLSARAFDAVLAVTLHGTAYCTMAVGKRWIEGKRGGSILSIVSTSVFTGRAFTVPSAAAKAGVLAMTRSLAVEWGPHGIRTAAIAPGLFPTAGAMSRLSPGGADATIAGVPLRRAGDHAEIANLASFLMSDQAGYINGDCITIDGGRWLAEGAAQNDALFDWTEEQWDQFRGSRKA